jgi:23S rRNA pseudouridine955/2504/2580 synthase
MNTTEPATGVRLLEVSATDAGQRIDNFLRRTLKGAPKSLIYRILRTGEVRVNSGRIKPDYRLQAGDAVRIPPLRLTPAGTPVPPPPALLERLRECVLHDDQDVLVLNKPAGLAVHGGSGLEFGLIEALRAQYPHLPGLELAHRLDRDTSGCLLVAKTPAALRNLQAALRTGTAVKRYLALVRGRWEHGTLEVEMALRKVLRGGEGRMEPAEDGKPARSVFRPLNLMRRASLLEALPATGRTHQLRVHAAGLDHPIAGDDKYGDADFNRALRHCGLRRLFLHAHSIDIALGGRELSVSAPLDIELKTVLDVLEAE